jgi:hypothetical protein
MPSAGAKFFMRQFFATPQTAPTRRAGRLQWGGAERGPARGRRVIYSAEFTEISLRSDALDQKLFSSRSI